MREKVDGKTAREATAGVYCCCVCKNLKKDCHSTDNLATGRANDGKEMSRIGVGCQVLKGKQQTKKRWFEWCTSKQANKHIYTTLTIRDVHTQTLLWCETARLDLSPFFFSHSPSVWPGTTPIPKIDIHIYPRQRRTSHIFHDWWSYQKFVCRWWHIIKHHTKNQTFNLTQTGWVRQRSSWCCAFLSSLILLADNYPLARDVVGAIKCENEDGLTQSHGRWDR